MKTNCEKCGSSDAKHVYEDHEFCFSCNTRFNLNNTDTVTDKSMEFERTANDIDELAVEFTYNGFPSYPISSRGISKQVVDHFGVKMTVDENGKPNSCLLYTSPSPRDRQKSRMPSSA